MSRQVRFFVSQRNWVFMDWGLVESNWDQYRARVTARWARLNPAHLDTVAGDRARLASVVREVYQVSSDEVEKQILNFELRNRDYRPESSSCSKWRRVAISPEHRTARMTKTLE